MLSKEKKADIIKKFGKNPKDTGHTEVQVVILSEQIKLQTVHLQINKKDVVTRRSLLRKVAERKALLAYLQKKDFARYKKIIDTLKIRK